MASNSKTTHSTGDTRKKTALITGITGQDGSYLAELLIRKGYAVHGIIRRSSSFNTGRISDLYTDPSVHREGSMKMHYADPTDSTGLVKIINEVKPDEVYSLGAQSHVKGSDGDGPVLIANAIRTCGLEGMIRVYQVEANPTVQSAATRLPPKQAGIPSVSGNAVPRKPALASLPPDVSSKTLAFNSNESSPSDSSQSIKSGQEPANRVINKSTTVKKPRDSLCIKRYEKLHAPRLQVEIPVDDEKVFEPPPVVHEQRSMKVVQAGATLQADVEKPVDQENDSGWGSQEYREVSPPLSQPSKTEIWPDNGRLEAPGPELNTKFMWDAGKFRSGANEVSFEENLALRHRQQRRQTPELSPRPSPSVCTQAEQLSVKTEVVDSLTANFTLSRVTSAEAKTQDCRAAGRTVLTDDLAVNAQLEASHQKRELELAEKLEVAEKLLQGEIEKRISLEVHTKKLEEELAISQEERQVAEAKIWGLEEKIHASEMERHVYREQADCTFKAGTLQYHTAREILQSITSSLVIFSRNLVKSEDHLEPVVEFASTVQSKVTPIITARTGHTPDEHLTKLQLVTMDVVHAVEEWRKRTLAKAIADHAARARESLPPRINEVTFGDDENAMPSGTRSSILPSSQQSDRTNPLIKALWNQTNQTMNCTAREPPRPPSDLSKSRVTIFDEAVSSSRSMLSEQSDRPPAPIPPVRQSLAARKSVKQQLQTSASEDSENLPVCPPDQRGATNFNIFMDQSCGPGYLPYVQATNARDVAKDSEDDSENTPPPDCLQADVASNSQSRRVTGVLNDSAEHPGVPVERLTTADFIDVESDSDGDTDRPNRNRQPGRVSTSVSRPSIPPLPFPRKSLGFGDFHDEFNMTTDFNGRKSIGGADQTLPFDLAITETDFFRSIDPKKHMASTPLVECLSDDHAKKEHARSKPRNSYLPPAGASKLLSPITEGSRENKSSTPSSSGVSTWIKSKKSLGNYSPLKENDEPPA